MLEFTWALIFANLSFFSKSNAVNPLVSSSTNPDDNKSAQHLRIHMENVTNSSVFLSDVKQLPVLTIEQMIFRFEIDDPPETDTTMNDAREDMGETKEKIESAKKELIEELKKNPELNVPWDNEAWLVRFLRVKRYNIDLTLKLIREYYKFKADNRHLSVEFIPSEASRIFGKEILIVMPNRDHLGRRIFVMRTEKWDPDDCSLTELFKVAVLISEMVAYEPATQIAGVQMIVDLNGFRKEHVWQFTKNLMVVRAMIRHFEAYMISGDKLTTDRGQEVYRGSIACTKCYRFDIEHTLPFRLKGLHVVNQHYLFGFVWKLFKYRLSEVMRERIHFHDSLDTLSKYIATPCLPDIYEGTFPIPHVSGDEWYELLRHCDQEFAKINSYGLKRDDNKTSSGDVDNSENSEEKPKKTGWRAYLTRG